MWMGNESIKHLFRSGIKIVQIIWVQIFILYIIFILSIWELIFYVFSYLSTMENCIYQRDIRWRTIRSIECVKFVGIADKHEDDSSRDDLEKVSQSQTICSVREEVIWKRNNTGYSRNLVETTRICCVLFVRIHMYEIYNIKLVLFSFNVETFWKKEIFFFKFRRR